LMVKELNGETYVFAVNRETKGCQAQITLDGAKPTSNIEVLFENRSIHLDGNGWTDSFQPFEVHVYRLKSR